jgi:hypothetical protein
MTILLGPAPCIRCKRPVTVVKRTALVPCVACSANPCRLTHAPDHTHAIPDVALAVVEDDGSTHICPIDIASASVRISA